ETGGIPFDNAQVVPGGYLARQVGTNEAQLQLLTFRYYEHRAARLTIPISSYGATDRIPGAKHYARFQRLLQRRKRVFVAVLDMTRVIFILGGLVRRYRTLLAHDQVGVESLGAKVGVQNVWRRVPFLDYEVFMNHVEKYEAPQLEEVDYSVPVGRGIAGL